MANDAHGRTKKTNHKTLGRRATTGSLSLLIVYALAACQPPEAAPGRSPVAGGSAATSMPTSAKAKKTTGLGMLGYNYTDLPISSYSVSGAGWGGDVRVSNESAGGSKTTCCGSVPPFLPYKYRVRWSRDDHRWCELDVIFTGPIPDDPFNFNTHFYQDGHVEISISSDYEPPRVKLPSMPGGVSRKATDNVVADDKLARCKDGK